MLIALRRAQASSRPSSSSLSAGHTIAKAQHAGFSGGTQPSGPSSLACGGASSDSPGLRFTSEDGDGVVSNWSASAVTLFAASDVDLRLAPATLSPPAAIEPAHARVVCAHGAVKVDGEALEVGLLAGEAVRVEVRGAAE